jgi:F0F1-type ATP synthase membrane subunit b/b'
MENFVATLHSQRQQQLAEIDENIAGLKKSLKAEGEQALDEAERQAASEKLAALESDRISIDQQYASLISEAERRAGSVQVF